MNRSELVAMLQEDLKRERMHLAFYTQAAVLVKGLHREEFREFFEEEAASELKHVLQFSETIVYLGESPGTEVAPCARFTNTYISSLKEILCEAVRMENEVAEVYAGRLRATHEMENADTAYVHVFYEDQISDSWRTAQELLQMIK